MSRRPLVAGNWKMHGSRAENTALVDALLHGMSADGAADVLICPPFVYLWEISRLVKSTPIALGAQSLSAESIGAFTGEVSASMLKDVGCQFALVGHSERRVIYKEDDALIARKFVAAQGQGLTPVLCIGETLDEREGNRTFQVIARQLTAVLDVAGIAPFKTAVIAYEPVWAIGTGKNATAEQAQEVHAFIRAELGKRDARIASESRILYGGSVKAANAPDIFAMPDVDGGLVGGACLKAEEFLKIVAAANR